MSGPGRILEITKAVCLSLGLGLYHSALILLMREEGSWGEMVTIKINSMTTLHRIITAHDLLFYLQYRWPAISKELGTWVRMRSLNNVHCPFNSSHRSPNRNIEPRKNNNQRQNGSDDFECQGLKFFSKCICRHCHSALRLVIVHLAYQRECEPPPTHIEREFPGLQNT